MIKNSIVVLLLLAAFTSCSDNAIFDQYVTIPDKGWHQDSMAVFKVDIENAQNTYNVIINIRNRSHYPNSNLWLFVDVISPNGKLMNQKLDCILADDTGRWLGSGWGDLFHVEVPFQTGVRFAETGVYTFRIVQGMRAEDISGIYNIGLRIEEAAVTEIK